MFNAKCKGERLLQNFAFCTKHFALNISSCIGALRDFMANFDLRRFALSQAQTIAAQLELKRVAEWRCTEAADLDAGRYAHLEDAAADFIGAADANDAAGLADLKLGRHERHAIFLVRTSTREESSSRKQSVLPPMRMIHGAPD
jgi:hypothetical protein